jgi:hypothetical protein
MAEPSNLPPAERAKRYRELEKQARRDALDARGDEAGAFAQLADAWALLAELSDRLVVQNATLATTENETEQKLAALRAPPDPDKGEPPKTQG